MSNYVLRRPTHVKVGDYGATSASATDMGSIRKVTFSTSLESQKATSSKYNDAVVEVAYSGHAGTLTVEFEEITQANAALALLATSSGTTVYSDADDSTPTYKAIYVGYFPMGGADKELHVYRAAVKPGTELSLANEQQVPTIEFDVMVDPDGSTAQKFYQFAASTADTTAPTVTWTPANACGSIATSCAIVWTFSEAVRVEDMTSSNVVVTVSGGTNVSGSLVSSCAGVIWTFTPSATLSACGATYTHALSPHIRDTAGNALASWNIGWFQTA